MKITFHSKLRHDLNKVLIYLHSTDFQKKKSSLDEKKSHKFEGRVLNRDTRVGIYQKINMWQVKTVLNRFEGK